MLILINLIKATLSINYKKSTLSKLNLKNPTEQSQIVMGNRI